MANGNEEQSQDKLMNILGMKSSKLIRNGLNFSLPDESSTSTPWKHQQLVFLKIQFIVFSPIDQHDKITTSVGFSHLTFFSLSPP